MTTTDYAELLAWLGPAADQLDTDQLDRLATEAQAIEAYWPGEDGRQEREAALSAAAAYLLGDTDCEQVARERLEAQVAALRARVAALQVAAMAVGDGTPRAVAARATGVDRMTLLERLGERSRRRTARKYDPSE